VEKWGKVDYFTYLYAQITFSVEIMMQFLGNIEARIDAKARVFVPASFRKLLQASGQNELVLRKDIFQNCLVLYPLVIWEEEVAKLRSRLSRWDKTQQNIFRQFVLDAERLELDANGRVLIPKRCLQMASIESDVTFLGVDNTIEIWAKGELEKATISAADFGQEIERLMGENV